MEKSLPTSNMATKDNLEEIAEQRCIEYATTGFIAKRCGVTNGTVLRWIRKQQLPAFRLPSGHYRVRRKDFAEFLANCGQTAYISLK